MSPDQHETPDAVAPPPRHPRFPLIDGLRAIAVLCVVGVHSLGTRGFPDSFPGSLAAHLNIGVTIFFLISGFLLYRPFVARRTGGAAAPAVIDYARRRVLRIFPAYWLVLTAVIVLPGLEANSSDDRWLEQYALVFTLSGDTGWAFGSLSQTWSLVVEFSFYAVLPLYVLLAGRLAAGRSVRSWVTLELSLLAALGLASAVLHFGVYDGVPPPLVGGSLLSFGLWFALGMALAVLSVASDAGAGTPRLLRAVSARPGAIWTAALAAYAVMTLILPPTPVLVGVGDQLLAFLMFSLVSLLLLVPAVFSGSGGVPRAVLSFRPVAWLGLISYGLFLWHIAVIQRILAADAGLPGLVNFLLAVAITTPIAAASYYVLERPILKLKYRRSASAQRQ